MNTIFALFLCTFMISFVYSDLDRFGCYWAGEAPFCEAGSSCRVGFMTNQTSKKGAPGDFECLTGRKKYCCIEGFVPDKVETIIVLKKP